jgi:predicted DNA-binding transcriptional regulator AlpA
MSKQFLSTEDIASLTGLSVQFFYTEIYKRKSLGTGIPYHRFGPHSVRFDPEEVISWLETRTLDFRSLKEAVEKRRAEGTLNIKLSEGIKNRPKKIKKI